MVTITPKQRNKIIDEVIDNLILQNSEFEDLSIFDGLMDVFVKYHFHDVLNEGEEFSIPQIFLLYKIPILQKFCFHWWSPDDLDSRILFLKSIKTCHS